MTSPPAAPHVTNREAVALLGRALRYVAPLRWRFAAKTLFTYLSLLPALLVPWSGKIVVDNVIQGAPLDAATGRYPFFVRPLLEPLAGASGETLVLAITLWSFFLVILVGAWTRGTHTTGAGLSEGWDIATRSENMANVGYSFAGGLFGWFDFRWTLRISHDLNHHYRSRLFERVQRLPMAELDDQRIGDAIYRLMHDAPGITDICYRLVLTPIVAPLEILVTVWVMWLTYGDEPIVVWTALAAMPLTLLVTVPFSSLIRRRVGASRTTGAATTTTIEEGMSNVLAVQSLGGQQREKERFESDSWRSFSEFRGLAIAVIGMTVLGGAAGAVVGLVVYFELTDRLFDGALSIGDLFVIFAFYAKIAGASSAVGSLWIAVQGGAVAVQRVFELMDAPSEHQPSDPIHIETVREGYVFEDVHYSYPDGTEALRGVDFEARRGSMVALVGPAGAGKTSTAYMFPRFLSPTRGRILVDGVDLAAIDRDDLRAQVAFVFQEPVLFDATVAENIRRGKADATDREVRVAAETAGASEFIERLPQGYDTPLGRGGGRLSMGQKQRLSIARALVRGAPVLVLDEPTAALDPETELRLVHTLRQVSRERLVVVIAHRLSTVSSADQILFIEAGRAVERGTHRELMMRAGGSYRRFVELQTGSA